MLCKNYKKFCLNPILLVIQIQLCIQETQITMAPRRQKFNQTGWWTSVTPAFGRLKQKDWELEASLGYLVSSRPAWAIKQNSVRKKKWWTQISFLCKSLSIVDLGWFSSPAVLRLLARPPLLAVLRHVLFIPSVFRGIGQPGEGTHKLFLPTH